LEALALLLIVVLALFATFGAYRNSSTVKGARGERRVNAQLKRRLPVDDYTIFHDVTLDSSQGSTQIDHIVLSQFGVFVIETKNYQGWIFGDAKSKQWTQTIYGKKSRFQNPLRQNYKHIKAVESYFSLDIRFIHSVVVFVGKSEFKTNLPTNVTNLKGLCPYIRSKHDLLLGARRVDDMVSRLSDHKAGRESATPSSSIVQTEFGCPKCRERMVLRKAKRGKNAGREFWGCPRFPRCRGVRKITITSDPTRIVDS